MTIAWGTILNKKNWTPLHITESTLSINFSKGCSLFYFILDTWDRFAEVLAIRPSQALIASRQLLSALRNTENQIPLSYIIALKGSSTVKTFSQIDGAKVILAYLTRRDEDAWAENSIKTQPSVINSVNDGFTSC